MTREARLEQLKQDLEQYNKLYELAQRPRIKEILSKQITNLNAEQLKIQKQIELENKKKQENQKPVQKQVTKQQKPAQKPSILYTALTKYSFQDESKKVKIYFSLDNIGTQCQGDQIEVQFKSNSVQLRIKNYKKQNLLFSIKKTCGQIIPEQSKYVVKTNLITLTLAKKSSGTWSQLNFKQDKFKPKQKEDFSDPNASLMNMMKQMYQEGDENMKKTIAEAWTKSRDKTEKDAFKFD